jgi:hypothetical protein
MMRSQAADVPSVTEQRERPKLDSVAHTHGHRGSSKLSPAQAVGQKQ